jgi:glycosyltransferase involved in cell wall biosynthesis
LGRAANRSLDAASYFPASESEVFLHYRTSGYHTTKRLHAEGRPTLCVMEEVNSHVDCCHQLMKQEYEKLGLGTYRGKFQDHDLRLRAYEEVDRILCPSSFVKRSFLEKGFPEERLLLVNFGFTHPSPCPETTSVSKPKDTFRLLYVGQLNFRKGLRYAVEAFRLLRHPRKELVIVGPQTKVTGLEGARIPAEVKFAGVLKGAELDTAYASASAFVLPTVEEGLALVLGEAMVAGLPVITTTNSGGDDLLTDGVEGLLVPAADSGALLEAMQKLADSPELCERMGHAALAKSESLGDWDAAAQRLVTALAGADAPGRGSSTANETATR